MNQAYEQKRQSEQHWETQIQQIIESGDRGRAESLTGDWELGRPRSAAVLYLKNRQELRILDTEEQYREHQLYREELVSQREAIWVIANPQCHANLYTHITVTGAGSIIVSGDGGECILNPAYDPHESAYSLLRWSTHRDPDYVLGKARRSRSYLSEFDVLDAKFDVLEWFGQGYVSQKQAEAALAALNRLQAYYTPTSDLACYLVYEAIQDEEGPTDTHELLEHFGMVPSSCALHCRAALRRACELVTEKHGGAPAQYRTWMRSPWA